MCLVGPTLAVMQDDYDRRPPQSHELPALAVEFQYEYRMVWTAVDAIWDVENRPRPWDSSALLALNVWVECLLLHTRSIAEFFNSKRKGPDDVIASDYVRDWTRWDGGVDLEWLNDMTTGTNKRTAHITAHRVRVPKEDDGRGIDDVRQHVNGVWDRFRPRLTLEQDGWFQIYDPGEIENA